MGISSFRLRPFLFFLGIIGFVLMSMVVMPIGSAKWNETLQVKVNVGLGADTATPPAFRQGEPPSIRPSATIPASEPTATPTRTVQTPGTEPTSQVSTTPDPTATLQVEETALIFPGTPRPTVRFAPTETIGEPTPTKVNSQGPRPTIEVPESRPTKAGWRTQEPPGGRATEIAPETTPAPARR